MKLQVQNQKMLLKRFGQNIWKPLIEYFSAILASFSYLPAVNQNFFQTVNSVISIYIWLSSFTEKLLEQFRQNTWKSVILSILQLFLTCFGYLQPNKNFIKKQTPSYYSTYD